MASSDTTVARHSTAGRLALLRESIRNKAVATVVLAIIAAAALVQTAHYLQDPAAPLISPPVVVALLFSVAIGAGLAHRVARRWVSQASSMEGALNALANGDTAAPVEVVCDDQWGRIATRLNSLLRFSGAYRRLSQQIASGHLTSWPDHATDGAEGAIPQDARDAMQQLCRYVQAVQARSLQVRACASVVQEKKEELLKESAFYASQISDTSAAVHEMVESIRQVANDTSAAARVAEEARTSATRGSEAVSKTVQSMERIRRQVQSTSKRFKELGDKSQEIGEIVQLIRDVAERTSLLALNASIQAAMAGEAGQGFGVVAEEVERLSQRCNEATREISKLVDTTKSESAKTIAGMEESLSEVVEGAKLARQAGDALKEIDTVSHRIVGVIESISVATKQQVRGGVLAARSIGDISAVIHENAGGAKQGVDSSAELTAVIEELCEAARRFTVPKQDGDPASDAPATTGSTSERDAVEESLLGERAFWTAAVNESSTIG